MKGANQRALALALVALVALAARSWSWPLVFTDRGVRLLADTDPHYHVLRAERILHPSGAGVWFDPNLDWPNGAEVLWPPLFDGLLAATAWVAAGPEADRDDIARVGSYVPPVLGTVAVILAALLAAALAGEGAAVVTGFLCALMPALSDVSIVGRPDQHALEIPLALAAWLGFVHAWRSTDARRRRVAVAAAGISFALAFWNWMGSALVLAVPALAVAVLHAADDVSARAAARALGASAAVAAAVLVPTVAAFGPPGAFAHTSLTGIGLLHVAVVAGCAACGLLLSVAPALRRGPAALPRRLAEIAAALVLPALLTLGASPGIRDGVRHGLGALRATDRWHRTIGEFLPLIASGEGMLHDLLTFGALFGLVPLLLVPAAGALRRRWRARTEERGGILVLAAWAGVLLAMAIARRRFGAYAAVPVAIVGSYGVARIAERVARRLGARLGRFAPAAVAALAVAPTLPYHAQPLGGGVNEAMIEALSWIGTQPPSPLGRDGVAAHWDVGHAVQYYARRPVLASPFGTDVGRGSLDDWGAFLFSVDEEAAEAVLGPRRIGWVVLHSDAGMFASMRGFAPPGAKRAVNVVRDFWRGHSLEPTPDFNTFLPVRMAGFDGIGDEDGGRPLTGFRLMYEVPMPDDPDDAVMVYGTVAGAKIVVTGLVPGRAAEAAVEVSTNLGRSFTFKLAAVADREGRAFFRIPYATGLNGATNASPTLVTDGAVRRLVEVPERAVLIGLENVVPMG